MHKYFPVTLFRIANNYNNLSVQQEGIWFSTEETRPQWNYQLAVKMLQ